ncbi:hypothetical protein [Burkholderia seminalis]|nr:hypothetical protein [Burkholderia seminalis]MDN7586409.1 hypothetical protein [Burkholderia seminalis]
MPDSRTTARIAGTTTAGSGFPARPACGALQREREPKAAHAIP